MANLGYHYIYRKLRESGLSAERFFLSPIPYRSVEGDTLLERFGVIMAGISYECDVPALLRWLVNAGVEPARKRRDREGAPIIGTGGALTYINPLSLSDVSDFIVLGDGLPVLDHVAETLRRKGSRTEILRWLAEHPSILVPSVHLDSGLTFELSAAKRCDISEDYGHGCWIAPKSAFGDTFLVELQRGCARGCKYCTLPSRFGALRQRPVGMVLSDIESACKKATFGRVGLVTPEASDYRSLDDLLDGLRRLDKGVSFASLRADGLNRRMLRALRSGGWRSVTVAPESGDDNLRASCGKGFTNDKLTEALCMAKEEGISSVKLYFMIGLPGENSSHVLSIADLCGRIGGETGLKLTAAVSPFVPKPGTGWSGADFSKEAELQGKFAILSKAMRRLPKTTFQRSSIKEAVLEYALSWASSRVSEMTTELIKDTGAARGSILRQLTAGIDKNEAESELERLGLLF
jgi:radical SAM superfamily enzyme YgiQ (UPF0313 family)